MAAVLSVPRRGSVKATERNHQRARLTADTRRWAQWVLLRPERPERGLL